MSILIGLIIIIAGICFGVYFGGWVMFIGGIVDIIEAIKAPVLDGVIIGFGILKIIFASFMCGIIIWASILLGSVVGLSTPLAPRSSRPYIKRRK